MHNQKRTGPRSQISRQPLQRPHGDVSRTPHKPAHLLGRIQDFDPVGGEVIRASSQGSEARKLALKEIRLILNLMSQDLHAGRAGAICTLQLNLPQELLDLTRISLVFNTSRGPANNTVEHRYLLCVLGTRSQAPSNREFVLGLHLLLELVEGRARSRHSRIVTVD